MTPLLRYFLVQIPGYFVMALLLWWAVNADWLGLNIAVWIMALWVLKDIALYPLCRIAFETGPATGAQSLVGQEGRVIRSLAPHGQVKLNGEYWQARTRDNRTIEAGEPVHIVDSDQRVLIVEPVTR